MTTPQSSAHGPELDGTNQYGPSSSFAQLPLASKSSLTSYTVSSNSFSSSVSPHNPTTTAAQESPPKTPLDPTFPLFLLPLELREHIYSYLLTSPEPLHLSYPPASSSPRRHHPYTACPLSLHGLAYPPSSVSPYYTPNTLNTTRLHAEILHTTYKIYSESIHLLYTHNVFTLHCHSRLFLDLIGQRNRLLLRNIIIDWSIREEYQTGFKKTFSILSEIHKHTHGCLKSVVLRLDSDEKFGMLGCIKSHLSPSYYDLDGVVSIKLSGKRSGGTWLQHVFNCDGVCSRLSTSTAPIASSTARCGILRLPPSIRNRIYTHLTPTNQTLDLRQTFSEITLTYPPILPSFTSYLRSPSLRSFFTSSFSLLTTCKIVSREVAAFIYSRNTVRVYSDSIHVFDLLGSHNFSCLRKVEIFCDVEEVPLDEISIYDKMCKNGRGSGTTVGFGGGLNLYSAEFLEGLDRELMTEKKEVQVYKPPEWSMNGLRYIKTVLDRLGGKEGGLEMLVVKMVLPEGCRIDDGEEQDVGAGKEEYRGLRDVVEGFKGMYGGVEVQMMWVHCSYMKELEVSILS